LKRAASSRKKPGKTVAKATRKAPHEHGETCLQKHCKQWLDKSGTWDRLLIFHVANERKGGFGTHMHFKRMGVRDGVADWLAFPPGRAVAIELKDDEGEQLPGQVKFQRDWEAAGHVYLIARTLEEFQGIVNALMLFA
jgi:hypothetical protein